MALKKTSSLMNLGGQLNFVDGAAYDQTEFELPLSAIDRQVFVVTDVEVDHSLLPFDAAPTGTVTILAHLARNSQTAVNSISNPDIIATLQSSTIQSVSGAAYQASRTPDQASNGTNRDFITVIATPNWFIGGQFSSTTGGLSTRGVQARITGYIATADVGTYSALIVEQLN